jgi:hypothetical protein
VIQAVFEDGPLDGLTLGMAGRTPSYLLMASNPTGGAMPWIVVGADFDDEWPGQLRYELADELLTTSELGHIPTVVYRFAR